MKCKIQSYLSEFHRLFESSAPSILYMNTDIVTNTPRHSCSFDEVYPE